jgi:hypothetical protein
MSEVPHSWIVRFAFVGSIRKAIGVAAPPQANGKAPAEDQLFGGQPRQVRRGIPIALRFFIGIEESGAVVQRLYAGKIGRRY